MATTTRTKDYLNRPLINANPGTTDPAKDHLGRHTITADKDYLGRPLVA